MPVLSRCGAGYPGGCEARLPRPERIVGGNRRGWLMDLIWTHCAPVRPARPVVVWCGWVTHRSAAAGRVREVGAAMLWWRDNGSSRMLCAIGTSAGGHAGASGIPLAAAVKLLAAGRRASPSPPRGLAPVICGLICLRRLPVHAFVRSLVTCGKAGRLVRTGLVIAAPVSARVAAGLPRWVQWRLLVVMRATRGHCSPAAGKLWTLG